MDRINSYLQSYISSVFIPVNHPGELNRRSGILSSGENKHDLMVHDESKYVVSTCTNRCKEKELLKERGAPEQADFSKMHFLPKVFSISGILEHRILNSDSVIDLL